MVEMFSLLQKQVVFYVVALGLVLPGVALAQVPPGATILATVNIQNAKIVSQKDNVFQISFDITNRVTPQTGVQYAVVLLGEKDGSQFTAATHVYPDILSLAEHSSTHKDITFTAPASLSGTFDLVLTSENSNGFPFAMSKIGSITLAPVGGIEIVADTCYLTIQGAEDTRYLLTQGVDISAEESLVLHCSAHNRGSATTATPQFETHYRTVYGEVVTQTGGDTNPISFEAQEKKDLHIVLSKATAPQAYDVVVVLKSGSAISNPIDVHYVIQGESATIQNISLDKNFYRKGETATLSFIWSGAADTFIGSRRYAGTKPTAPIATAIGTSPEVSISFTLVDRGGEDCTNPVAQAVMGGSKVDLSLPIIRDCTDPRLTFDLKNPSGEVLAQEEISFDSERSRGAIFAIVMLLLFLGGGALWYVKQRHA